MPTVLFALTSHGELGDTGHRTGFYVPEVAHPAAVFRDAGYEIAYVSVEGGRPPADGVDPDDPVVAAFLADEAVGTLSRADLGLAHRRLLEEAREWT